MALIAVMRGKPRDGYHCRRSNKHYATVEYHVKYDYKYNPLEADYCCGRGYGKPKNIYHRSKKYCR
jgi:hypothetical protein